MRSEALKRVGSCNFPAFLCQQLFTQDVFIRLNLTRGMQFILTYHGASNGSFATQFVVHKQDEIRINLEGFALTRSP